MDTSEKKVALVTGATGIIGRSLCQVLTSAGWRVVASDRSSEEFASYERINGCPVVADSVMPADLASEAACRKLIADVESSVGPLSLLVNNATGHTRFCSFQDTDTEFCHRLLHVDLLAPLFLSQSASASLAANHGSIVNCSSVHVAMPIGGSPFYRVVKAAVEKLSETMVTELGPKGIRINTIRIGRISGDAFLRPTLEKLSPELARELREEVLLRYLEEKRAQGSGAGEDIANLVAFLASPQASFIQGAVIAADGGWPLETRAPSKAKDSAFSEWSTNPDSALESWLKSRNLHGDT